MFVFLQHNINGDFDLASLKYEYLNNKCLKLDLIKKEIFQQYRH